VLLKDWLFEVKGIEVSMLRLDKINPIISGNKIFKLFYFIIDAQNSRHKTILTFGGAYSNHLAATAFTCKEMGLKSFGIVRGERPAVLSHTLLFCIEQGMELQFLNRETYRTGIDKEFLLTLQEKYGEHILIPEGGFSEKGAKGASLISNYFEKSSFTHISTPVGTATTLAGLIIGSDNQQEIIGFSVLKNMNDIEMRLQKMATNSSKNYSIIHDYHFGGYAKKNPELLSFMNQFYERNHIPLDFVYTGKMMFGIYDLIRKDYFHPGSKILCIHTGGLQGNLSLLPNELIY
jgi:1-aminocyclopropane-1-carboxylate deaminase/D-cysteine desulfhydrase-like pyridoxal-dependent ACC family enzyme